MLMLSKKNSGILVIKFIEVDTRNPRVILNYEEKKKQIRKKIR